MKAGIRLSVLLLTLPIVALAQQAQGRESGRLIQADRIDWYQQELVGQRAEMKRLQQIINILMERSKGDDESLIKVVKLLAAVKWGLDTADLKTHHPGCQERLSVFIRGYQFLDKEGMLTQEQLEVLKGKLQK